MFWSIFLNLYLTVTLDKLDNIIFSYCQYRSQYVNKKAPYRNIIPQYNFWCYAINFLNMCEYHFLIMKNVLL